MDEHAWQQTSMALLTTIKEWRHAHPKATFVEIEDQVHQRMMELEAQILQDAAQASASREWGSRSVESVPLCPTCAVLLHARGKHQRTLQGNGGQAITLSRTYGTCLQCGVGFFPLDEELGLLSGTLAPRQQENLVHLASLLPFGQAAHLLETLLGVQTTAETARRLTERMGACLEAAQDAEAESVSPESPALPALPRCVVSADGTMVSLVQRQWVEVRTLAVGQPAVQQNAKGTPKIHVGQLSYFSRLADAATFTELAAGEIRRRQMQAAHTCCAVTDGADWCQTFTERYRPDAVRILDFPHAAEHLSQVLEALEQAGLRFPERMPDRCLHVLKHRGPVALLRMADRLPPELAHWFRDGGECQQTGGPGASQRGWDALAPCACQSDAGLAHSRLQ